MIKKPKYNNKKSTRTLQNGDVIKFDSKKELSRFNELYILLNQGIIKNLVLQPEFEIIPTIKWNKTTLRKIKYIADFKYEKDGKTIIEDVKGFKTKEYQLKKRLFLLQNTDLEFIET